jgi:hypothetical protein
MNKLYKFVDAIVDQENLVSQLDANVDFSNNNWNEIGMNLNDKNESLNRIVDYFP